MILLPNLDTLSHDSRRIFDLGYINLDKLDLISKLNNVHSAEISYEPTLQENIVQ